MARVCVYFGIFGAIFWVLGLYNAGFPFSSASFAGS